MSTILTLHDPQTARQYYLDGVWQRDTMYGLLRDHARNQPDKYSLRDGARRLSWSELLTWVEAVAEDLHQAGLRRGSRICVWLPSRVESVVTFLACSRNGYICNPSLHQNYTVEEILQLLRRVDCAAFVGQSGYGADADRHDIFAEIHTLESVKRAYRVSPRDGAGTPPGGKAVFPSPAKVTSSVTAEDSPDKIVYLAFTSGTTGTPKGVMHSDNSLLANGRAMVQDWRHVPGTILMALSPMSHHIGTVALEQMLVAGFELALNDCPGGRHAIDWIVETGATYVMGVPTHAIDILAEMRRRGMNRLGKVRVFYMAGAPIPRDTAQSFLDVGIVPQNVYGMTENGSHQYTLPDDDTDTIVSTCGRACKGYEIKIWKQDKPDEEAQIGEIGEIGGRGGLLMLGYFANQSATENSFNNSGWFMSGDLGKIDRSGTLMIMGRKKDLIIRGGHNIHPARVEDLTLRHPRILQASAFAVADERLGEKVCLAIIAEAGYHVDAEELLQYLYNLGLSKFDMPEYFVSMEEFPRTASGKILKRELVEWVRDGRVQPVPIRWIGGNQAKRA